MPDVFECCADDFFVVEGEVFVPVVFDIEPDGLSFLVGLLLDAVVDFDECEVCDCDEAADAEACDFFHPGAVGFGVADGAAEGFELVEVYVGESCTFFEYAVGGSVEVFVGVDDAAGEFAVVVFVEVFVGGVVVPLDEEDFESFAVESEYYAVDGYFGFIGLCAGCVHRFIDFQRFVLPVIFSGVFLYHSGAKVIFFA